MPRFAVLTGFVLLFCVSASAEDLSPILADAMRGTQTPGMAALVMRDGKIAGEGVQGVKHNDRKDALTKNELWHIGSDGKPITATLIAKLVDQGKLSWSTTLAEMLPELAMTMRPEYRSVTLLQLLTHTAGFDHDSADTAFFNSLYKDTRPPAQQRLAYVAKALTEAPIVPPGTKFSYSNTGFLLAAVLAERVTGKSYEELMRREVFAPLGMTSAGFGLVPAGGNSGHIDGKPISASDGNPAMFAPAGNMYMSMHDWAAFCLDQMAGAHGHGKLLKQASYQAMQTVHEPSGTGISWGAQATVMKRKGPALTHAGSDGTWYALVVLFPDTQSGALVAANAGENMGGDKTATAALKVLLPTVADAAE